LAAAAYRDGNGLGSVSLVLDANGPEQLMTGAHMLQHQSVDLKATLAAADRARQDAQTAQKAAADAVRKRAAAQEQVARAAQAAQAAVSAQQSQLATVTSHRNALLAQLAAAQRVSVQLEQQRQQGLAEEAARRAAEAAAAAAAKRAAASHSSHTSYTYDGSAASRALAYAYAQLGKPYVWGGTGPYSFDCSGLTMRAWESAGVMLPHFAAFQYQASHPLAYSSLRPGDLLFWATDGSDSNTIYHEAIYIGGQRMIQAPRSGENVEISSIWMWGPIQFFARPD
jgi:cell wall-associated NlpC family hydrolase